MRAVIFDFNGTMIFDTPLQEKAWNRLVKELCGREITREEFTNVVHGTTNRHSLEYFTGKKIDAAEEYRLSEIKEGFYRGYCEGGAKEFAFVPGLTDVLDNIVKNGVPHNIATSAQTNILKFYIDRLKLDRWFDAGKIAFDDGSIKGKPAPDLYLKATANIGVNPKDCLCIEDTFAGLAAARSAGIGRIVAMQSSFSREALSKLDYVYDIIDGYSDFERLLY